MAESPFGLDYVDQLLQPFCACGRVVSRCDGSRKACGSTRRNTKPASLPQTLAAAARSLKEP